MARLGAESRSARRDHPRLLVTDEVTAYNPPSSMGTQQGGPQSGRRCRHGARPMSVAGPTVVAGLAGKAWAHMARAPEAW
jgi:hypothetical protein